MTGSAVPAAFVAEMVAAARGYLRLGDTVEAALLGRLAETAVLLAERYCGHAIAARTFEDVLPVTAAWQRLRARPVTAIAGVTALPVGAAPVVLAVDAYAIDIDAGGDGWVRVADVGVAAQPVQRVAVSYSAGLAASWEAVSPPLAQGMVMLVAHLFEHRGGAVLPPAAVAALWRPFRTLRLLEASR